LDRDGVIPPSQEEGDQAAVDTTEPGFSTDELLAQISAQLRTTDEGLSTREMCLQLGIIPTQSNRHRIWRTVSDLRALGKVVFVGKKSVDMGDGDTRLVKAYKYVEEEVEVDDRG